MWLFNRKYVILQPHKVARTHKFTLYMAETRKIQRALVSVFHKDGLEEILRTLNAQGVELLSTGAFEDTVASGACPADIIEKIDIGGISLIRAAAKNFRDVIIVPSKAEYKPLLDLLQKQGAQSEIEDRKWFATRAFGVSSHYDTAIHSWFEKN